ACIENPLLAWGVLSQFNSKLMNLISQIERASFHTATQQISLLLFDFWKNDQLRAQLPHYRSLLKVTHQELADATGKTRVSITNALHRLKQKGAIALHHGHIEVLDPDLLIEDEEALGPARQRMAENPPADRVASAA